MNVIRDVTEQTISLSSPPSKIYEKAMELFRALRVRLIPKDDETVGLYDLKAMRRVNDLEVLSMLAHLYRIVLSIVYVRGNGSSANR